MSIVIEALPEQQVQKQKECQQKDAHDGGSEFDGLEVDFVELTFHDRCRPRQIVSTTGGRELALALPRGTVLTDGVVLHRDQELVVTVVAKPEAVVRIQPEDNRELCVVTHHLGNWHRSLEALTDGSVLTEVDAPLEDWLKKHGIAYSIETRAYQPNLKGNSHD